MLTAALKSRSTKEAEARAHALLPQRRRPRTCASALSYPWTCGLGPTFSASSDVLGAKQPPLLAVGADGAARLFAPAENGRLTGFFDGDLPAMRPSAAVKAVGNAVPPALARAEAAAADRAGWYDGDGSGAEGGGAMADS